MAVDLSQLSITEARDGLSRGDYSAKDLAESALAAISASDADIHAFLEVFSDVREQAEKVDAAIRAGKTSPLLGIPLGMKDNVLIEGRTASAGSKILANHTAVYDSTVTKNLREAGAVFVGRTNMDEFAMGSSTENSAFGPTRNPLDPSRVPGGSSGGSAAAVAAGFALGAIGTDTGGSIRQPAAFCGLVGLKPTYGSVSRAGLVALGSSLDQAGPLVKTVADARLMFSVLRSHDPLDSTSLPDSFYSLKETPAKPTIGVPAGLLEGLDPSMRKAYDEAIERFRSAGCAIKEVELPNAKHSLAVYYIVLPAEVSANLSRYDGVRYGLHEEGADLLGDYLKTRGKGFGPEPRRRIVLGTYLLSHGYYDAYYNKAMAVRKLIVSDFENAFRDVDVIVTPTTPTPPFKLGEKVSDPLTMYLEDIFTTPVSLAGVPALSIPAGTIEYDGATLPVGIQLIGAHSREDILFAAGELFERSQN